MIDMSVSMRLCAGCVTVKAIIAKGMCRHCYNESRKRPCANCKKVKLIHGRKLCSNCYHKLGVNENRVLCIGCGHKRPHYAKNKCKSCYNKALAYKWRSEHPDEFKQRMSDYQRKKRSKSRFMKQEGEYASRRKTKEAKIQAKG